jgi:hypothetical protein
VFFLEFIIIALTVALLLSALILTVIMGDGRQTSLLWIFLIAFLSTWAGGIWVRPFGPSFQGVY